MVSSDIAQVIEYDLRESPRPMGGVIHFEFSSGLRPAIVQLRQRQALLPLKPLPGSWP